MPLGINGQRQRIPDGLTPQEFAKLFKLTPAEAVAYMAKRGLLTKTFSWQDLWESEHAHQFTISRLARMDLLAEFQEMITQAVSGDLSRTDFYEAAQQRLEQAGWWGTKELMNPETGEILKTTFNELRLKLIFDTNTRMAYAAGQWERADRNKRTHPYLRYQTLRDERVRASHREWDGVTLPIDDPFWDTHYPPNGWNCRCRTISMSRADVDKALRNGITRRYQERYIGDDGKQRFRTRTDRIDIKTTAPVIKYRDWTNKSTGKTVQVPVGIDPGFGYNVGKAAQRAKAQAILVEEKLAKAPAPLAEAAVSNGLKVRIFEHQATAKAASDWALSMDLVDFSDFSGIKPEVANAFNRSLFDHLEEFPALRPFQKFSGSIQAMNARWLEYAKADYVQRLMDKGASRQSAESLAKRLKGPKTNGKWMACSSSDQRVGGVAVNKKWGSNPARFLEAIQRGVASGFHPSGTDSIRSIADHEFGHQLSNLLGLAQDHEVVQLFATLIKSGGINHAVSVYASTNIEEFIAECWAEFRNSSVPRDAARAVGRIVISRYRSTFSA